MWLCQFSCSFVNSTCSMSLMIFMPCPYLPSWTLHLPRSKAISTSRKSCIHWFAPLKGQLKHCEQLQTYERQVQSRHIISWMLRSFLLELLLFLGFLHVAHYGWNLRNPAREWNCKRREWIWINERSRAPHQKSTHLKSSYCIRQCSNSP